MKWIVDAQLPKKLAAYVREQGDDAVHTLDMPNGNATSDEEICIISLREQRIVISKDEDFIQSYFVRQTPYKLLFVCTGNISNEELLRLMKANYSQLQTLFQEHSVIELQQTLVLIRD